MRTSNSTPEVALHSCLGRNAGAKACVAHAPPLRDYEHWLELPTHYLFGAISFGSKD
jgi:hypothetical protein